METTVQEVSTRGHKSKRTMSDVWYSILLISPAMLIIFFFALFPLFYAINISFRYVDLTKPTSSGEWVGLENFRFALNDPIFWEATGRTLTFAITSVAIEMVVGIFIAFQLSQMKWFKGITRSLLLLPLAAAPIAVGLVWRYMYHSDFGVFNAFLAALGLPEQNWLGDLRLAMPSIIVFDIWQWTPFVAIITLAGLQSLPKEPFEAAELDGASTWQVLRRLTFPMLTPVLTLIFVLRAIDAVRLYDAVASLTRGGPGAATETLTYYLYRLGLKYFRMDQASAMSLLFLYAVVIFTGIVVRRLMREQAERAQRE
jgi:multiple sugar transport system permease protein